MGVGVSINKTTLLLVFIGLFEYLNAQTIQVKNPLRLDLTINQPIYAPGDTIWFKTYFTDGNNHLVPGTYRFTIDFLSPSNNSLYKEYFLITDGIGYGQIPIVSTISAGVYSFTISLNTDSDNPPKPLIMPIYLATNLAVPVLNNSIKNTPSLNHPSIKLNVNETYGKRQPAKVIVELTDSLKNTAAEFSISIYNRELFEEAENATITAFSTFETPCTNTKELTQINRVTTARISDGISGLPLADSSIVFLFFQTSRWRYQTITKNDGLIKFTMPTLKVNDAVFCLAKINGKVTSNVRLDWMETSPSFSSISYKLTEPKEVHYGKYATEQHIIQEAYNINIPLVNRSNSSPLNGDIVSTASATIRLTEYKSFPTMEDYVKEILPNLSLRKIDGKRAIKMRLSGPSSNSYIPTGEPVYLINGIATQDSELFLSLNPSDVELIKLFHDSRKLKPLGIFGENGIIVVELKNGKSFHGLQQPQAISTQTTRKFKQHFIKNVNQNNIPCFEANLVWEPSIRMDLTEKAEIEFYTSDYKGTFNVLVTGRIADTFFFKEATFQVK